MTSDKISHKSQQALLLIDVVNHFEFPDGEQILRNALKISAQLRMLKARARKANIPVIYVNDNSGQWQSDATKLLAYCLRKECAGRLFVEAIRPDVHDYCVLKPHAFGLLPDTSGCAASPTLVMSFRHSSWQATIGV